MRICNFENFLGVIPRPPLKGERIGKEGVGQGNERRERSRDWTEEEVTGREGIDGRSPFHKS
jgi:hypothetical protein